MHLRYSKEIQIFKLILWAMKSWRMPFEPKPWRTGELQVWRVAPEEVVHQEEECHLIWEEVAPLVVHQVEVVHHQAWVEEDLVVLAVLVALEDLQEEEWHLEWEEVVPEDQVDQEVQEDQEDLVVHPKMQPATYLETKRIHWAEADLSPILDNSFVSN